MPAPRMRTIKGAVAFLKEQDPGSEITEYYIRRLVKTGEIPSLPVGCKRLIDVDQLSDYLKGAVTA